MNESLKRAQANYQEKCRMVNIRFNTETEKELIEWLDIQNSVGTSIKVLIQNNIEKLKEHKVRVEFYEVQVKYSGRFEDYTTAELYDLATARDPAEVDHVEEMSQFEAMKIDGSVTVEDRYPCNKIAVIRWSCIDEETFIYPL